MSPEPAARLATSKAGGISYLAAGSGAAVVLLHGICSGARSWQHQLSSLADRFRIIAWDAPGYGGSASLAKPAPEAGDYARSLAAFLKALAIDRCHLVGHSLGALIAARFAAEYPDRILSLTLASIASGHARLPEAERARLRQDRLDELAGLGVRGMAEKRGPRLLSCEATDAMRDAVIETMAAIRPDGFSQAVMMLSGGDIRADVARLPPAMPMQIVFGDQDQITTPEANRLVASERPQAPVHVIAGAGHAVYIEKPDAFNSILAQLIAAPSRSG